MKLESKQGIFSGGLHLLLEQSRIEKWDGCLKLTSPITSPIFIELEKGEISSIFFQAEVILSFPPELDKVETWNYQLITDLKLIVAQKIESMKFIKNALKPSTKSFDIVDKKIVSGAPEFRKVAQSEVDYIVHYGKKFADLFQEKSLVGYVFSTSNFNAVVKFALSENGNESPYADGERIESTDSLFYGDESFSEGSS